MKTARLGDLCEIQSGGTPRREDTGFYGGSIPWAKIGDLKVADAVVTSTEESLTDRGLAAIRGRLFPPGTVLLAMYGSVGKVAVAGAPMTTNQAILGIQVTQPAHLSSEYLRRWLEHIQRMLVFDARGVTQQNISATLVRDLRIPLPSLAEQRRIAAVLDRADAIRRKRRESLRLLDEFLHGAYAALVGRANTDYGTWPQFEIAGLADPGPESMRTGPFGSALRHSEFVDSGVAVLGIDNAVQNRFAWAERRFITQEKYEKFRRYTVKPGDVIVTIMGTTGRSAVVPDDIPRAISTKHLAVITVDRSRVHPVFLSHAVHSDPTVLAQIAAANRGAIMAGLNLGIIKRLRLRLPSLAAQECFAAVVEGVQRARNRLGLGVRETDHLFDSLAQRAFREEL